MKISYGKNIYGKEEINAVVNKLHKTTQMGSAVITFEKKISKYLVHLVQIRAFIKKKGKNLMGYFVSIMTRHLYQ